jgi:hypothetical protein
LSKHDRNACTAYQLTGPLINSKGLVRFPCRRNVSQGPFCNPPMLGRHQSLSNLRAFGPRARQYRLEQVTAFGQNVLIALVAIRHNHASWRGWHLLLSEISGVWCVRPRIVHARLLTLASHADAPPHLTELSDGSSVGHVFLQYARGWVGTSTGTDTGESKTGRADIHGLVPQTCSLDLRRAFEARSRAYHQYQCWHLKIQQVP